MQDSREYLRFLIRTRRRWSIWRCVELAGVCAAVGAIVALLLMPIFFLRGTNSFEPSMVLIVSGAVAGFAIGVTRQPSLSQTALRADEQFGLHDLLSTALMSSKWNDAAFAGVILAQADAACGWRSPSEIIVARISRRAWGGIAVAGGLTLSLAMLLQGSPATLADGVDDVGLVRATRVDADGHVARDLASERIGSAANRPVESNRPSRGTSPQANAEMPDAERDAEHNRGDANSSAAGNGTQSVDVAGSQEARTDDAQVARIKSAQSSTAADEWGDGTLSIGGSRTAANLPNGTPDSAARGADTRLGASSGNHAAPWSISGSLPDSTQAETEIRSGRVPDSYRDVVGEYFGLKP